MGAHLATAALATITAAAAPAPTPATGPHHRADRWAVEGATLPARSRGVRRDLHLGVAAPRSATRHRPLAHRAAGDPGVTIADFRFTAATTTVHVGDTITWTNDGPSPHTATAGNGSFDTGTLGKGQSASHTFSAAGTYTYFCKIHPFMHGTIVVLAAAGTAPSTATATQTTTTAAQSTTTAVQTSTTSTTPVATSTAAATARPALPNTGLDVVSAIVLGGILLGAGLALRRAVRA